MNYIILSIPVFFLLIGIELLIDKYKQSHLYRFNDAVSNISCGIAQQVSGVFFKTILIVGYVFLYDHYRFFNLPNTWWMYLLLFIGIDFFYYWFHRMSHEISFFWGAHIVHHQSEDYNLSVALRQSTFQAFVSTVFYLPLALLGFNPVAFVTIGAFQTLYQFWIHTKTIDKLHPAFEYVFNTPSHHRVHHGRNPQYIDKNHGGTLIVFDRMFGTFQPEEEEVVYGVTKPLSSWNPLWANFDYYVDLWHLLQQPMSWWERIQVLVRKPGWMPAHLGGYQRPKPVTSDSAVKYDTAVPPGVNYYVFMQYIMILGFTSWFLFTLSKFDHLTQIWLTAWILLGIANMGAIFELRKWVWYVEWFRFAFTMVLLWILPFQITIRIGATVLISVSALWFFSFRPLFRRK